MLDLTPYESLTVEQIVIDIIMIILLEVGE